MRALLTVAIQAAFLFLILSTYSDLSTPLSFILALFLSFPSLLLFREKKRTEIEDERVEASMKPIFRKVLILTLLVALTFPFSFRNLLEASKPEAPKEKFDLEALVAGGRVMLVTALYFFSPWFFALILAKSYGYSFKALRSVEARRHFGQVYFLFFLLLVVGLMSIVVSYSPDKYQFEGKIMELVAWELALFAGVFISLTVLLRKNGYGWKDLPELIAYSSSLDRSEFSKDEKADLTIKVVLGIFVYAILAFWLADSVFRGEF